MIHILVGFCLLVIGCVFTGLVSAVLWVRLRTGVRYLDAPLFLALWMFVVTMLLLCACALGVLDVRVLTAVSVAGAAIMLLFRRDLGAFRDALRGARSAAADFGRSHPGLTALYALLFFVLALRTFVHAWVLPPYIWDTLAYHLPRIPEWIQHRGLFVIDTPIERLYWPANFELFQCWFVVFFHHDFIIELAGVFPYALAVLSIYSICRSFGVSARWASGAAAIFSTTPAILQSVVSCQNDIAMAAWFLFIVGTIAEMTRNRGPLLSHARYVAILALAFGVALGTKPYIVFIAPGLVLLYLLLLVNGEIRSRTRAGEELRVGWLAVVLVLSLFVGLFWYARNAVVFGNPFHPAVFRMFGHVIVGAGPRMEFVQNEFKLHGIAESLNLLKVRLFDPAGPYAPELPNAAGWGWFAVSCGLPAVVVLLFSRSPSRLLTICFSLSLCSLFGFVRVDPWHLRYAVWFPAIFAVAFVILVPLLKWDSVRGSLVLVAVLCCLGNIAGSLSNGYLAPANWKGFLSVPVLERSATRFSGECFANLLQTVPAGETIGYDMDPNGWLYPLYGADYRWRTMSFPILGERDVPGRMKQAGIRYLLSPYQGKWVKAKLKPLVKAGKLRECGWGLYERVE